MAGLRRSTRLSSKEDTLKNRPEENESTQPPKKKSKKSDDNESLGEEEGDEEEESEGDSDFKEQEGEGEGEGEGKEEEEEEEEEEEPEEAKELEEGDPIPDILLKNQDGKEISLKKVSDEHKIVVIFGYPKASTPGCTRQACGFRDNYEDIKEHAAVFGLSADTVNAQKKFQEKQHLPFDLLSDPERHLVGLLGAKKSPESGIIRSHWVFADGVLKHKRVKISPEVSIEEGKKEVLELVKQFEDEGEKKEEKGDDEKKEEEEEDDKKEEDN
ncbi:ZYRO0C05214p [Zygosaccharomyces rouxii]|uniref:thioredoxin-dependent peroxiredoxin n=1 Tax=Zygosaccharomyces rouxii (strain ATCC 2623 / CBS 732 / NBRC 1130 / NCYC 568 / NRRL Y-229) TaxID=559307 RepID=C5DT39_ZYGRC|nr:uncharacterized protein ZYRO0C05214g [Zygosaccharomyces rouxii]KAH9201863.1 thioredoxin-like protein [Zygosaccharomyces rouxii]CAR26950.1 ZYRO0C05214p [Zygosaccharomyces rouxii]